MISVKNLEFSYNGSPVLKDINVGLGEGKVNAILGPNGAGKSTLLKCLNAILKPKKGCVYIDGNDIKKLKLRDIAKLVGYVPQKSNPVLTTVFDYILLGRRPYIGFGVGEKDLKIVKDVLKSLKIENLSFKRLNQLSGGEFQKVVLARALAQEAKVLLLDEPINNLDLKSQFELMNLTKKMAREKNITVAVVVHDINIALRFADEFIFIKDGRIVAKGGKEIVTPQIIEEVYGLRVFIKEISGIPVVVPI